MNLKKISYLRIVQYIFLTVILFSSCHKDEQTTHTDLSITKATDNTEPIVGSNITVTIIATNNGPGTATGVNVNYSLPSGYTFVSATPSTGTWAEPKWVIGILPNAGTATLKILATVNAKGSYDNAAIISGTELDPKPANNTSTQTQITAIIPQAIEVNFFVWDALSQVYLWNDLVPNLTATKFATADSLNLFLNTYSDPQLLFTDLLYKYETIDKWSFLVENSQTIDDWISGTSKTMGYDFMLVRMDDAGNLLGYVRYVFKDSPAEKAGIKRGDLFLTVNDLQLTTSNYKTLLFNTDVYKLGFASITNNDIVRNDKTANMSAVEMQENPINKDTVFVFNNQVIGYLVYNAFNPDYDIQLNEVIKKFKDANVDQMVVDLRYNGGGSVQSSIYLASMLYGTDETKLFTRSQYNAILQSYITQQEGADYFNDHFASTIKATATTPATLINTLNLQKVYFIVSDNTASASELLINGLKPYMNVKVVGINTYGKYVASFTIKDLDNNGNAISTYAMQPIVAKYANSLGVTDFVNGLTPDITASEISAGGMTMADLKGILPFGDPNEKLLSYVLADISGKPLTAQVFKSAQIKLPEVANSHEFKPFVNDMYINRLNKLSVRKN